MNLLNKIIIIISLITSIATAHQDLKKVSLQLQWKHQFQFAGYYMAKEKGFYKDAGFDVQIKESKYGMNVPNEVVSNSSTYGVGRSAIIVNHSYGNKVVLLAAIFQSSPNIFITINPEIKQIKDFKNKSVMVTKDTQEDATITSMLFSQGVSISDMQRQEHSFDIDDLINHKVDIMSAYISNEPFILTKKGIKFKKFIPKDYGYDFYNDLLFTTEENIKNDPEGVRAFTRASLEGWKYAFNNIEETVNIILHKYNTQNKSKEELIFEAHELKKLAYFKTDKLGFIDAKKIEKIYEYYRLMGFTKQKVDFDLLVYPFEENTFSLTFKEKKYLNKKKYITMCIDPQWMPFESFDKNGNHIGMSAEYYKTFGELLSTPFKVIKTQTWTDSLQYAKQRKCDILSLAMETPKRKEYMNFTTPYLQIPAVLATNVNTPYINDIKILQNKKVGVVKNGAFSELMKKKYQNLHIIEIETVQEGLEKVENGELFGFVDTITSIGKLIQTDFVGGLKVSSRLKEDMKLSIGVRNDDLVLFDIMQKLIGTITPQQSNEILNKWNPITYDKQTDYSLVLKTLFISLVFIVILLYINLKENGFKNELKKQKNKLQEQKDEFETIFRTSKDGIVLLDLQSNFLNCNDEYLKITGFTREELFKKSCFDMTTKDEREKTKELFEKVMQSGYIKNFEKTCIVKDNKRVFLNMSLSLMPDKKRILISAKDMSQIKQLESQKKLASMGQMIGSIAHQWRQPLNNTSLYLQFLKDNYKNGSISEELIYKYFDRSFNQINYMSQTIDDFTKFLKDEKSPIEYSLNENINSFLKIIEPTSKENNISIIINSTDDLQLIGYPNELIQCFINIFNNSKDAFKINNIQEDRYFFITYSKKNNIISIEFKDNAGGIPENILSRIFEPYFTTKDESQGIGLGLHIVYDLVVNSMGGSIDVENVTIDHKSKEYKGVLFRILLKVLK